MEQWYRLDNAAKLFPAVSDRKNTSVFRVAVILTEMVDGRILQQAADHIYSRFPMMFVRLHRGVFWNYIDENEHSFRVREETSYPCAEISPYESDGYMLRILYCNKRISLECFHSLTDGGGALELLKSLLYYYLRFSGKEIDHEDKVITSGNGASLDETEDSYQRYYRKMPSVPKTRQDAYSIRGTDFQQYGNNVTTGIMSANALNTLAKSQGATITSYLSAAMAYAILETQPIGYEDKRPIVILVPVNLRKLFPSDTLRNFSCVTELVLEQRVKPMFPAIVTDMTTQLRAKTDKDSLQKVIAQNIALERNTVSRFVPLLLKRKLIALGYGLTETKTSTITLSNLGNIAIPSKMFEYVDRFEANVYNRAKRPLMCGVCSVGDRLTISFSRTIAQPDIIRRFFTLLAGEGGLDISVYSNNWGM
jgi:NRPS condensation-like uncharacterized protein